MAYNFKKLSEVDVQDKPSENTTVMAFESGQPKQLPASEFGGKGLVIDLRAYTLNTDGSPTIISDISYDPIYESIASGKNIVLKCTIDGVESFMFPIASAIVPGQGLGVLAFMEYGNCMIVFTNGSHHSTTETASK